MWEIVWVLPQVHRSVSVSCHFLLQALQCPSSVRKRFSRDHCCRGRSKPGCRIVGSHTGWELAVMNFDDSWLGFDVHYFCINLCSVCCSAAPCICDPSVTISHTVTSLWHHWGRNWPKFPFGPPNTFAYNFLIVQGGPPCTIKKLYAKVFSLYVCCVCLEMTSQ